MKGKDSEEKKVYLKAAKEFSSGRGKEISFFLTRLFGPWP